MLSASFEFDANDLAEYARTCGELAPRYTDPKHPDFQAPPTFPTSLHAGRRFPDGFPHFPGLGMDAGKAVAPKAPIRPGVKHVGRTHLHDIYTKTGRSGRMVFMVIRMELFDPSETLVATADTRTARVWDAATGEPITPTMRVLGIIREVAFAPDGTEVSVTTTRGDRRVWGLRPDPRPVEELRTPTLGGNPRPFTGNGLVGLAAEVAQDLPTDRRVRIEQPA